MPAKDWVVVGVVAKPHGITGELSVACHAESPAIFGRVASVGVRPPGGQAVARRVLSWRAHQERVLLRLEGVPDRTQAEGLRRAEVLVRTSDLPRPGRDEVYLHELEGCRALLADGSEVGVVQGFLDVPGQEIWVIKAPGGAEVLFPAAPGFVLRKDPVRGEVVIDPPEGLLDLYLHPGSGE